MSDPMQTPITGLPRPIHTPNPEFVKSQYEDKNENISLEYIKAAIEAMKDQPSKTAHQIADCADVFWEWAQAQSWKRGQ